MIEKALIDKLLRRIKKGAVRVTYWDGDSRIYGESSKPKLRITITDRKVIRAIAKNVSLGVGEAYIDGTLLVDGPLNQLAELGYNNEEAFDLFGSNRLYKNLSPITMILVMISTGYG